jgi:hypothetical protein
MASVGAEATFLMAYTPTGKPVQVDLSRMKPPVVEGYWYNPRSGAFKYLGEFETKGSHTFTPWSRGWGSDFLLILTDPSTRLSVK